MKNLINTIVVTVFSLILLTGCGNNQDKEEKNLSAYEMMENAFEGYPRESEVKPIMEDVMETHNMLVTEENLERAGSVLVTLRKESKVGVTEMEILKHMYQKGNINNSFADQAATSFLYLESTK